MHHALDPDPEPEVFEAVWGYFGPQGLTYVLLVYMSLHSVWASIAQHGTVTPEAVAKAVQVTINHVLIGLYFDLGTIDLLNFFYLGSSFASALHSLASRLITGVAWRVLGQHEKATYRASHPSAHYSIGYRTNSPHRYALLLGIKHSEADELLRPLRVDIWWARCALTTYLEGGSIAVLGMYVNYRTRPQLEKFVVTVARLAPGIRSTNRATGMEINDKLDTHPELQAARGRKGGPKGAAAAAVTRTQRFELDPEDGDAPLYDYIAAYDPKKAKENVQKGAAVSSKNHKNRLLKSFLDGTKTFVIRPPGAGQLKVCVASETLAAVCALLGQDKIGYIALPLPSDEIKKRPSLIGTTMCFRLLPPLTDGGATIVVSQEEKEVFRYTASKLHARSRPKWREFLAYMRLLENQGEED